jgi:hypothetical protein
MLILFGNVIMLIFFENVIMLILLRNVIMLILFRNVIMLILFRGKDNSTDFQKNDQLLTKSCEHDYIPKQY